MRAPRASRSTQRGRARSTSTPPSWRFDLRIEEDLIEEVIRVLGYDALAGHAAARHRCTARCATEARRSAHALRHAMADARLPGDDQLQLRRGALGARTSPATPTPIRVLNPIARAAGGDALEPDRQPGRACCATTWRARRPRVRVFEIGRVFRARRRRRRRRPLSVAGIAPADARSAALAYGPADAAAMGRGRARGRLLRRQGRRRGAARAGHRALRRRRASGAASRAAARAIELDGERIGVHRRAASALAPGLRAAGSAGRCSSSTLEALRAPRVPAFAPLPRQQSAWRDMALVVGERRHATMR